MSLSEQLLADVHNFVSELGISETALGQKSVGNPSVFARLRAGKSVRLDTADRIRAYMAAERARLGTGTGTAPRRRPWWRRLLGSWKASGPRP